MSQSRGSDTQPSPRLTDGVLSQPDAKRHYPLATQARFLELAGQGKLSKTYLSQWLSQDRLYAQAYCRFIGGLASLVELPTDLDFHKKQSLKDTLEWRIMNMLKDCLDNILDELSFFEDTAKKYGLDLTEMGNDTAHGNTKFGPNKTTQGYIDLFDSFGGKSLAGSSDQKGGSVKISLLRGLLVLWATEKCYFDAWSFAKSQVSGKADRDEDGGALRDAFIPRWTSDEFQAFLEEIRVCLDEFASVPLQEGSVEYATMHDEFLHVLRLEEGFWPVVE